MAKWRLHFDGDNVWIEKEARIYSLTDDVERKINSIPNVIDNTSSTSATDALSANMGRDLQEQINNLASRGRYLSTWNAETWLPDTNPQVSPYVYRAWDYYIVSNVVSGTNYRPHGSSYVVWEASTDVETESISVNDLYIYDWAQWIRQWSWSWASVTWWSIVGILSNQTDLQNALNAKANATDVNTKTFYLTWTTGEANMAVAREIHEWMSAWNTALIHYWNKVYTYSKYVTGTTIDWWEFKNLSVVRHWNPNIYDYVRASIRIVIRNWSVYEISASSSTEAVVSQRYVDNNDTYIWSSAPTDNVVEWRLWYDTTNDVLKVYDGTNWNTTWATYTAWDHIEISNANVISTTWLQEELTAWDNITIENVCHPDNQWPCSDGFHVPSKEDLQEMCTIMSTVWLSTSQVDCETYLKLPYAGMRNDENANQGVGVAAFYHASNPNLQSSFQCWWLYWRWAPIGVSDLVSRKDWCSLRPFKDTPSIPDNSWTTLYQWTWSAWIFHNATLWLISLSWDWANWLTIADKNLWATQVFNYWDTYSEANCWKFYQWWNNYGFARTWSITGELWPVNATWYWPWNYYSSNVFRLVDMLDDWINPSDDNLWWWVSQWTRCQNVISAEGTTYTAWNWINIDQNDEISVDTSVVATQTDLNTKQDTLTAWENIQIDTTTNTISATDTKYSAWRNITIWWTLINARDTEYEAWNNITITCPAKNDIQWPCPDGFHIPTRSDWNNLIWVFTWLWLSGAWSFINNFKTPMRWYRSPNWSRYSAGSMAYYWAAERETSYSSWFELTLQSNWYMGIQSTNVSQWGFIRPFKDTAVIPDSTWEIYYDWSSTATWAWIFHNASDELISASSDWITRYTIKDKNIWATEVRNYNYEQRKCWYIYQRWNCYGFPLDDSYKKTSIKVNAAWYWPWNYYYSDERVTEYSWDNSNNANLWWWQTQWTWQDCEHPIISAAGWATYTAWNWIDIDQNNEISVDTTVVATQTDIANFFDKTSDDADDIDDTNSTNKFVTATDKSTWDWKQDELIAWTNIQIAADGKTISATDTTYTAWTWIALNWTTFSADTTVLATKQDIADLWTFEVVASLPSVATADTKTIYLLGPIWTGDDKYEEWIVTEDAQQQKQWTKIWETSVDLSWYATTSALSSWLATKADVADVNTKTFRLSTSLDAQDLQRAHDAVARIEHWNWRHDWVRRTSIIKYDGHYYFLDAYYTYQYWRFICPEFIKTSTSSWYTEQRKLKLELVAPATGGDPTIITAINPGIYSTVSYLDTVTSASGTYTPTANNNPATKKYVDDAISWAWYTAWSWINIDANNEISNTLPWPTIAATAPTWTEWALWYDTTNNVLMAHDWTDWKEAWTQMKVLSYGSSTWQDFIDAYNENAIVYCKASSNSNPWSWVQWRMAFMAFVDINSSTQAIQGVEFQYYRSRSSHSTAATVLDEVYIYKLTPTNGWTWTVTQRDTAAKPIAWTWIWLTYNASGMTISADTNVLQGKLTAWDNVSISAQNVISAVDTTYEAWDWITIWRLVKPTSIWTDYHIPSYTEWDNLITAWTTLWAWTENDGVGFSTYLKMPTANSRSTGWVIVGSGDTGSYRTTTPNSQYRYILSISHRQADAGVRLALTVPWYAESVRCFKNTPEVPDSWWTTLYDGSSVATNAWIFYDATNWLISISADGTTWYTIMDKNVWATTVYNYWDTLSQANCGKFYQRWNYYGFPWNGTLSDTSSTQVDTTWYSADGELYYDDTFITWSDDWSSSSNTWLRSATWPWFMEATIKENAISTIWYKTWRWIAIWDIAFKNRWPCAVWYHIGTKNEFFDIYSMWINMWAWTSSSGTNVSAYLLMPYTWVRSNTSWARQTSGGNYWTCSWYMSTTTTSNQLTWGSWWFNDSNNAGPSLTAGLPSQYWFPIRPLKDEYVAPDSSWTTMFDGSSYATWAWIFWNQTLWIISITDWTNWYTLADKNQWATTVRRYWDETTDDNCGNVFQWWNNYAFPRSWNVATNNTVVNVEWYWPDNPYSNSTFRLYVSIMGGRWWWYGEWADNLWWWEEAWPSVVPWDGNYIWNTLPFDPINTWSTWQLLTKNSSGYEWQTKYTLPTGTATSWYVLTKTASSASSYAWRAAPATWIQKASASPLDIKYIWAWTQAEYDALDSYSADTLYFTV